MSETALKAALLQEGEARMRAFWQEAETTVSAERQEVEAACAELRSETERQLQAESALMRSTLLFAAQARSMEGRLHAETALEQRLLQLAGQLLPALAGQDRADLWHALRGELPDSAWGEIRVHPADRAQAESAFPEATIVGEDALGGGLVATSAGGAIRIDNSLSCRLRRAWPDLLPQLLDALRKQVDNHAAADPDQTG